MPLTCSYFKNRYGLLLLFTWLLLSAMSSIAATSPLVISKATYSAKTNILTVAAKATGIAGTMTILHSGGGGILASREVGTGLQTFAIPLPLGAETPCAVEVRLGGLSADKAVSGASATCAKAPECAIVLPKSTINVQASTPVNFSGLAKLKDKSAAPLKMEWDFAGGSLGVAVPNTRPIAYKRPTDANTTVQFVRDNARYRVRFTAWDKLNRYCSASVIVNVGTPPTNLPNVANLVKEAQNTAAKLGSQLAGKSNDVVVLPFPNLTLQHASDSRYMYDIHSPAPLGPFNSLNAQVYRKDRLPPQLAAADVQLKYSASSNPDDPVNTASINSTSQNWPLNADIRKPAPLGGASVAKTDVWDFVSRPAAETFTSFYYSANWFTNLTGYKVPVGTDEGIPIGKPFGAKANVFNGGNPPWKYAAPTLVADDHGRYMPGHDAPFAANAPQDFTTYLSDARWFTARNVPVTDIDDSGRVNPYPMMRVAAIDKTSGQTLATTDAVVSVGTDFHCRECHAKGKIAANDKLDWSAYQQAYHSTTEYGASCNPATTSTCNYTAPVFSDAVDRNGQPSTQIADQEYAAIRNMNALHDFYDIPGLIARMEPLLQNGLVLLDSPTSCTGCHQSLLQAEIAAQDVNNGRGEKFGDEDFWPRESPTMHRFHAELQLDPSDPSKILRGSDGRPLRWDPSKGANPNTLFPTVDSNGNALAQELSCLRCHAGQRDPLYRDRMYTAGITCYDCHGDMLAVGMAYNKPKPGPEGFATRLDWYEQPDCGSCHTGDANQGKDAQNGFFSAGVMKRAFDVADRSASTRPPKTQRFAVQATKPVDVFYTDWLDWTETHGKRSSILSMSSPLYRNSKDTHGDVACGACHGGAHEIWPNRDPKANDNVTAMQLQGHTGTLLECNVCHTADAFKNEADLDGGVYSGDSKAGILGGPHNTHPINDPYWWKSTAGDSNNADGTTYGGWHNNYAKKSGKDGEDQCAACHGNDHKGTRLSRTPVDRVFDFSGFNQTKLKKAGLKSAVIKVAADSAIGCDTCHSIKTSCIGSPAGQQCGVASSVVAGTSNHDPVITSTPTVLSAVMGQAYSYKVTATDADGDPLTFGLGLKPGSMVIDPISGVVTTTWPVDTFAAYRQEPFVFPYSVYVKDGKGGYASQNITLNLRCPDGQYWAFTTKGTCVANTGVTITSKASLGVTAGDTYTYQVAATSAKGLPLTYSVTPSTPSAASGLVTIDAKTGLLTWKSGAFHTPTGVRAFLFTVKATDGVGSYTQTVSGVVCKPPKAWDNTQGKCVKP